MLGHSSRRAVRALKFACLFGFCATFSGPLLAQNREQPNADRGQENAASGTTYDILPLIDVRRTQPTGEYRSPVNGYVRFIIERVDAAAPVPRLYGDEARSWLSRYFTGRTFTRLLRAQLTVNREDVVTSTVTLAAASHQSNRRQGETWSSELGEQRFLTPLFRVDAGTTASIEVSLSANNQIDPDITRNILDIVERGARLAAGPTGPLVTSLNASRLSDTSNFIDNAISTLFSESIAERSQADFPAEQWLSGRSIVEIQAAFPMRRPFRSEEHYRNLGGWRVRVSEPVASIFSQVPLHPSSNRNAAPGQTVSCAQTEGQDRQACLAFVGLTPARVLGLPVAENVTLGEALRSDSAITAALTRYQPSASRGTSSNSAEIAGEICRRLVERTDELGLNAYDSAAAVWAFSWNGNIHNDVTRQLADCPAARLAERLGLPKNVPSAPATGATVAPAPEQPADAPIQGEGQPAITNNTP